MICISPNRTLCFYRSFQTIRRFYQSLQSDPSLLSVASKRPVAFTGRFKQPVAFISHFKATPQSALVIDNQCLPAEFKKATLKKTSCFYILVLFCKSLSNVVLRTITFPRSILFSVYTATDCRFGYLRIFTLLSRDKRYSQQSEIRAFATSECLSVLTNHFHLPFMLQDVNLFKTSVYFVLCKYSVYTL